MNMENEKPFSERIKILCPTISAIIFMAEEINRFILKNEKAPNFLVKELNRRFLILKATVDTVSEVIEDLEKKEG